MFDTSKVWANVLKGLRESGDIVLHAMCAGLAVDFCNDFVTITVTDSGRHALLSKHLATLNKFAGGDYIRIELNLRANEKSEKIERLKELFGDKVNIEP